MKKDIRGQFKVDMFSLEHENPLRFVQGPWRRKDRVPAGFFIYRIVLATTLLFCLLWSAVNWWKGGKWMIFLTNWGFTILTVQSLLGAILTAHAFIKQTHRKSYPERDAPMPFLYKLYWMLYNMAVTDAFYISMMYWGFVHNPERIESYPTTIINHLGNSLVAIMEILVGGPPSRLLHAFQPLGFGLIYVTFTIIYWKVGGTNTFGEPFVYRATNWNKTFRTSMMVVMSSVLIVSLHALITAVAGLRSRMARKYRECEKSMYMEANEMWMTNSNSEEAQEVFCNENSDALLVY